MRFTGLNTSRKLKLKFELVVVIVIIALVGCTPALPRHPGKIKAAATYKAKVDIRFHGFQRTYLVHLPPGYNVEQPLPMVVVLHGAFDTAKGMQKYSEFSDLADEKRFIALYPNGIGILGYFQHWNAGHCCGKAAKDGIDDVGFIATVIEDVCSRMTVDRRRIYMVGFSNGGMMTYRFAAERGDLLAAIAPLAASAGGRLDMDTPQWSIPEPVKALPVLTMHGMDDTLVPFTGGIFSAGKNTQEYWSVNQSLGVWVARDGCNSPPVEREERQGKVHIRTWNDCADNNKVVLYTLEGWRHVWPGPYFTGRLDPQVPLYNFDAARIIWDFFESPRD